MVPELHTERMVLRMIHADDAPFFYEMNADPEVIRYTGDEPFASVEAARFFIAGYDQYELYGVGRLAMLQKGNDERLGWCGLKYHPEEDEYDIGFRLFKHHWGRGFATEAALAVIQDGFNRLGEFKLVAHVHMDNHASMRVLQKLGMEYLQTYTWSGNGWRKYVLP